MVIGVGGILLCVAACDLFSLQINGMEDDSTGNFGVCTDSESDGSGSCSGVTNIDYGTTMPPEIDPNVDTPQTVCENAGGGWSPHCATDMVCVYADETGGITMTIEIGESAATDATDNDIECLLADNQDTCIGLDGLFTNNTVLDPADCTL